MFNIFDVQAMIHLIHFRSMFFLYLAPPPPPKKKKKNPEASQVFRGYKKGTVA